MEPLAQRVTTHIHEVLGRRPAIRTHGGGVTGCCEIAEGSNAEVWRIDQERGSLIARFWKIESKRNRAEETQHLHGVLARLGVASARLIDTDISDESARRFGFHVTVEECIEGRHLAPGDLQSEAIRAQLIQILLSLHGERSDIAGHPWRPTNREHPWDAWNSYRIGVFLERARETCPRTARDIERLRLGLTAMLPPVREIAPFHLTHGDVQPANYLLTPSGRVVMIDLGAMVFGAFQRDLALGEMAFDLREAGSFHTVLNELFERVPERRAPFERHRCFFRAQEWLRRSVSAYRKAARPKYESEKEALLQRADAAWDALLATVNSPETGE
jgi:aminoglycoside phosphotransferase (APT) family kinase protein